MRYIKDFGIDKRQDILDFANMVFSMEYTGIDFSVYLPKAYGEARSDILTHHMFVEDDSNKIRALIDTYPIRLKLDDITINADYVGTVAVHPKFRNMGLFSNLMEKVYEAATAKGSDLLILDGERARYGRFGYEKAGMKYSFAIEYKSALNMASDESPYEFEEVEEDSLLLEKMYELYSRRNVTARDASDFYISLLNMKASVYAVIKNGRIVGYVNMSSDEKSVNEFELEDIKEIPKLMADLLAGFELERLDVTVGADEIEKIKYLESVSQYYNVSASHQIRILNYVNVIQFLLKWKQKYSKLIDGEYIFGIIKDGIVTNYKAAVKKSAVTVVETEKKAENVFSEMEFVKIMMTEYFHIGYNHILYEKPIKPPAGWFPLPFFLPEADTF
jgi:predicted acetyltransferase